MFDMESNLPLEELARLKALDRYSILDTMAEQSYDDITKLAAYIAQVPIALISLVDDKRQWFKSKIGLAVSETPREVAFCAHAIQDPDHALNIPDALDDERFAFNPLVTDSPNIRFYFGTPLVTQDHYALGTLCVIDRVSRKLTDDQKEALAALARQAMSLIEMRKIADDLQRAQSNQEKYLAQLELYQQQLELDNVRLKDESMSDKLTGIGNRAAFDKRLTVEVYRAKRYRAPLSLLMIDVDRFKDFNDAYGHQAGDAVLQKVAATLSGVRPSDFVARYGGEEFAIILPTTSAEEACNLAERIRTLVSKTVSSHRQVTVSIGVSTLTPETSESDLLIAAADKSLYAAKRQGRNQVVCPETVSN
jgi:diguanylate cyclase (GGDEF)-like protein